MGSSFPIVHAKWFIVFRSANNAYYPKTAVSSVLMNERIEYIMCSAIIVKLIYVNYTLLTSPTSLQMFYTGSI